MKNLYKYSLGKLIVIALMLMGIVWESRGQTIIVSDGLNNSSTLFTLIGGAYYTGNSIAGDRPATSPFAFEGTHSFGLNATSTVTANASLTSTANINTTGYTGISLSFKLAAFSIGSTTNGLDQPDAVIVSLSTDGGATFNNYLTINGTAANNAYWSFAATGNAVTAYPSTATFAPTTTGSQTVNGYSNVSITSLPAIPNLRVRISMNNNAASERWLIDDFKIQGTATCTPPTTQAQIPNFSVTLSTATNTITPVITSGSGGVGHIIVVKQGSAVTGVPTNGNNYLSGLSADFSQSTSFIAAGEKVVYSGTGSTTVTGLTPNTTYYFAVFEFTSTAGSNCYFIPAGTSFTNTIPCTAPTTEATNATISNITNNTADLSWTNGSATNRLVVINAGSAVTGAPVDGVAYSANADYSIAPAFTPGTGKVIYNGTGNTISITGLANNTTYFAKVFEFRSPANCYSTTPASTSFITSGPPVTPSLIVNPASLTGLDYIFGNGPSASQPFMVSGTNLTGAPGVITITCGANYEVSSNNIAFGNSVTIGYASATLANTTLYLRLNAGLAVNSYNNESISITGGGATAQTLLASGIVSIASIAAFDNFDRSIPNTPTVGIPSSGGAIAWTEIESGAGRASVEGNQLRLSTSNTPTVGGNNNTAREMISFDMTGKYATIFSTATGDLEWYFNMKQSRGTPSGFDGSTYGAAFVIGCNQSDYTSATANGYAVIIGNTGNPDNVKLIYFTNGLVNTYANGGLNEIAVSNQSGATPAYSIHVTFNPCTNLWSLQVRNDGANFANPTVGVLGTVYTGTNNTHVNTDLKYMGALWNHQGPVGGSDDAFFDNFFIPLSVASANTYLWNGNTSTDYQVATNWTPARNCPKVNDVLVFDASSPVTSNVTNVPTQTIGKLIISGNRNVIFKDVSGDAAISFLTIGGGAGTDFSVEAGSTFRFDVAASNNPNDALIITLNTGATAVIDGTIIFQNTNAGNAGRLHQLFGTDASSIIVNLGAIIRAEDLAGDPFGTTGTANVVQFLAGSLYESVDGSNPFGLTQPLSKVVFQSGSTYRHLQTSPPSFSGRVYADFEYAFIGTSTVTGGSNIAGMTVDNLKILSGVLNVTGTFNSSQVNINIKRDLTVSSGATFNYSPGAEAYASIIGFSSSSSTQKINSLGTITFGRFATLELNNTHTTPRLDVETDIRIQESLKITAGILNLSTGNITMQSDANSTANVTPVNGTVTYGTGRFVIERFITSGRKWRFLSAPVTSTQSIRDAWMEGALAPVGPGFVINNPLPGYGMIITDENNNAVANGFDSKSISGPSLKYYDPLATTSYTGIANPSVNINSQQAYMAFVRGDRSCLASNSNLSTIILRTKGQLNVGDVNTSGFSNGEFKAIGNPYPARIDLRTIFTNAGSNFTVNVYVWDPKLTGSYGLGGFQTLSLFGGNFVIVPGGGSYGISGSIQNTIESGQAFFVRANAGAGTVQIKETDKVTGSSVVSFTAETSLSEMENLKTTLSIKDAANNSTLVDGALVVFDAAASNEVDLFDALKLKNTSENIAIKNNAALLSVEQKAFIENNDSIHLNITGLRLANYQLKLEPNKLTRVGRKAFLVDRYLQTTTALDLINENNINFTVNNNAASYAPNRMVIVFKQLPTPTFVNIVANINADKTIAVKWDIANENEIIKYEVERSNNGNTFERINSKLPLLNNNNTANFTILDAQPLPSDNYYRIKMYFENGTSTFSKTVKVDKITEKVEVAIMPNVVTNKLLNIQLLNKPKGRYMATIFNALGEKLIQTSFNVLSYSVQEKIKVDKLSSGIYTLSLIDENGIQTSYSFVVQ